MRALTLAAVALALLAGKAGAQIEAQGVRWQLVTSQRRSSGKPLDVDTLDVSAGKLKGRLVARVKLFDKGPDAEGILLRYAVSAKIAPGDQPDFSPLLAVPFSVDERRVPRVRRDQWLEVPIDVTSAVTLQLRRLAMEGFVLRELRFQVMVAPRRGDRSLQSLEASLPVKP